MFSIYIEYFLFIVYQTHAITSPYGWKHHKNLGGLWNLKISPSNDTEIGFREAWYAQKFKDDGNLIDTPVPSSYNDIGTDRNLRDFLGWVWYQTKEPVNIKSWNKYRTVISFGGVHYYSHVWFGTHYLGMHEGGHLPFEFEMPNLDEGFITVAVNNTLNNHTIPQGFVTHHQAEPSTPPYQLYSHDFDYFDYAGINRNVFLYATSKHVYIKDLIVRTDINISTEEGFIQYEIMLNSPGSSLNFDCLLKLRNETTLFVQQGCKGVITVKKPALWWNIFSIHGPPGNLYTFTVEIINIGSEDGENIYTTQVGIRSIRWNNRTLLLNEKPIYLKGFGKHEDSDIRGRGFDWAVTLRDFELLKWTHANVIRTTHYPPSLELIDVANRMGLMLIVESPACSLSNFDSIIYQKHENVISDMISAYGNNPSVILWSLANEPVSTKPEADNYFRDLVSFVHSHDTRPVTFVTSQQPWNDKAAKHVDIICVNRYNGWYSFPGGLEHIESALTKEVLSWKSHFNVPFFITEYGAGSLSGLHNLPSSMWSEDYQTDLLKMHFIAFDRLKAAGYLAGEMLWVFADFATPQEYIRPGACVKGIFTRQRQPKKSAYTIRERYTYLDYNSSLFYKTEESIKYVPEVLHTEIRMEEMKRNG